jgi:hypothetical protein
MNQMSSPVANCLNLLQAYWAILRADRGMSSPQSREAWYRYAEARFGMRRLHARQVDEWIGSHQY